LFDTLSSTRRYTSLPELLKCPRLGSQHNQFLHDIWHRLIPLRRRAVHLRAFILKVQPLLFVFPKERKKGRFSPDVDGSDSEEEYYDENDHDDSDHDEESDEETSHDAERNKDVPSFLEALRILSHPDPPGRYISHTL
jgi:hypothetical protein